MKVTLSNTVQSPPVSPPALSPAEAPPGAPVFSVPSRIPPLAEVPPVFPGRSLTVEAPFLSLNGRADPLTAALSVFTRFLSLPPEGELMARLRRAVLSASGASNPRSPRETLQMEAKALAAAAALDKGLALSPPALEKYAALLDREAFSGGEEGRDSGGGRNRDAGGGRDGTSGGQGGSDRPPQGGRSSREQPPEEGGRRSAEPRGENAEAPGPKPETLRALAGGAGAPLLALLNRLRGKNGQRWILLPLTYTQGGKEYLLTLRMLLRENPAMPGEDHFIADIRGERRWIFSLHRAGPGGEARGELRIFPGVPEAERRRLETGLRGLFEGDMAVRNGDVSPSLVMELEKTAQSSVNKEV